MKMKRQSLVNVMSLVLMFTLSGCCWFRPCRPDNSVVDLGGFAQAEDLDDGLFAEDLFRPSGDDRLTGFPTDPDRGINESVWEIHDPINDSKIRPVGNNQAITRLATIHFDYDKSNIRPDQQRLLDDNTAFMLNNPDAMLTIEGHTDERGTAAYNLALGDRRADSAREYLIRKGVQPSRIATVSYGKERPVVQAYNEDGWAQNRRAEFKVHFPGNRNPSVAFADF